MDAGVRLAIAAALGCALTLFVYAALRVIQAIWFPEPNPAVVIGSERAGYFWRLWMSAYVGGMGAIGAWFAAGAPRRAERCARALPAAIGAALAAIALQGALIP